MSAQITLFLNDPTILPADVLVTAGAPPVDQSVELAAANARIAKLTAALDQLQTAAQARKDADAATVDGQAELDVIAAART